MTSKTVVVQTAMKLNPHSNTKPMRPAEAQFTDMGEAAPVDDEDDAAAEALVEGEFIVIDMEDSVAIEVPDEVPVMLGPEAESDAEPEGVIVTCAGTAGPVER